MPFNYKKISPEWLHCTEDKKTRDAYYYHITRLSTFREFIEHSGLTTSYNRTFKLHENENGALAEGKTRRIQESYNRLLKECSQMLMDADIPTNELSHKVSEFINNPIFDRMVKNYQTYDLNLQNLAKDGLYCSDFVADLNCAFKNDIKQTIINKQIHTRQHRKKPINLTIFYQLPTDSFENFQLAFDTLSIIEKNKIKYASISTMALYEMIQANKQRKSILQALIFDNPTSMFTSACMVLAKLNWNAEVYMCSSHIYFFDLCGLKDNFFTYATNHLQGNDIVLIRVKKKDTLVIPDPQQFNAFISSQNLPSCLLEYCIFRGQNIGNNIANNIQWIHTAARLNSVNMDFGEEPSYEQAQLIYSQMKKTNNDINPVLKFYHQFTLNKARFRLI